MTFASEEGKNAGKGKIEEGRILSGEVKRGGGERGNKKLFGIFQSLAAEFRVSHLPDIQYVIQQTNCLHRTCSSFNIAFKSEKCKANYSNTFCKMVKKRALFVG